MRKNTLTTGLLLAGLWQATPARAVIVAGPQGRNTSAPAGTLAGSGWDLQGAYGAYLGTPISPNWFVTAAHFGAADDKLTLGGTAHPVTGEPVPIYGTDLVLREVSVPFTAYAPVFNRSTDAPLATGDTLVVFGRGPQRGDAIAGKGWAWGAGDSVKSWGTNTFDGFATVGSDAALRGRHHVRHRRLRQRRRRGQ